MGLRCMLGHDFGSVEVAREHEEDGNEMVVTEREVRTCQRCGEEQVLSESTEVRAIRTEADIQEASSATTVDDPQTAEPTDEPSPEETPGVVADDVNTGPSVSAEHEAEESNTSLLERAEEGFDEPSDPADEDAVILDESEEKPEREHGAWPESDDVGPPEGVTRADVGAADDADADADVDADVGDADAAGAHEDEEPRSLAETAAEEDAELLGSGDASDAGEADAEPDTTADATASSSWPEHDGEDEGFAAGQASAGGPEMAYGNEFTPSQNGEQSTAGYSTTYLDTDVEERDGDGSIVSASTESVDAPRPGVETEYYCPNCEATRPLDSSIRSGDICPDCQSGYIAERER